MFYYVLLRVNHIQLNTSLIGVTENPVEFANKWLSKRSQFQILSTDETAKFINCLQLSSILTEEQEEKYKDIKRDITKKLYHHTVIWREVGETGEIYISLEKGDYLSL
jgi:hypothetical protein